MKKQLMLLMLLIVIDVIGVIIRNTLLELKTQGATLNCDDTFVQLHVTSSSLRSLAIKTLEQSLH